MSVCQVSPRRSLATVLSVIVIALTGCGGGGGGTPTGPSVVTPPGGTGTGTLLVQATVQGRDSGPGVYETVYTASVFDTLNQPASAAVVTIAKPGGGSVIVPEVLGTPGTYQTTQAGYSPGTYTLSVTWGLESISGARVTGPTIHTITQPLPTATITAGQPISVTWSRTSPAQNAKVETRDYESLDESDDMASTIPGTGNPVRTDQRVRVKRSNQTAVTAGLPGSKFEAVMRNTVEPLTAQ